MNTMGEMEYIMKLSVGFPTRLRLLVLIVRRRLTLIFAEKFFFESETISSR